MRTRLLSVEGMRRNVRAWGCRLRLRKIACGVDWARSQEGQRHLVESSLEHLYCTLCKYSQEIVYHNGTSVQQGHETGTVSVFDTMPLDIVQISAVQTY